MVLILLTPFRFPLIVVGGDCGSDKDFGGFFNEERGTISMDYFSKENIANSGDDETLNGFGW